MACFGAQTCKLKGSAFAWQKGGKALGEQQTVYNSWHDGGLGVPGEIEWYTQLVASGGTF